MSERDDEMQHFRDFKRELAPESAFPRIERPGAIDADLSITRHVDFWTNEERLQQERVGRMTQALLAEHLSSGYYPVGIPFTKGPTSMNTPPPISATLMQHQTPPEGEWDYWWMVGPRASGLTAGSIAWAIARARLGRTVVFHASGRGRRRRALDQATRQAFLEDVAHTPHPDRAQLRIEDGQIIFGIPPRGTRVDDLILDGFDEFDNRVPYSELVESEGGGRRVRTPTVWVQPRLVADENGPIQYGPRDRMLIDLLTQMGRLGTKVLFTVAPDVAPDVVRTVKETSDWAVATFASDGDLFRDAILAKLLDAGLRR